MIGEVVADKYKVIEAIREHERGGTYLVKVKGAGSRAILTLAKHQSPSERAMRQGALMEASQTAQLRHPHILSVRDVQVLPEHSIVLTDHLVGIPLETRLASPISLEDGLQWLIQLARALAHAHSYGIAHGRIRARHVLLTDVQGRQQVRLAHFADGVLVEQGHTGPVQYEAPEQELDQHATAAADQYAYGILMFRMLAGRYPFEAESEASMALASRLEPCPRLKDRAPDVDVPEAAEVVMRRCLEKLPQARHGGMREVARALSAIARGTDLPSEMPRHEDSGPVVVRTPVPMAARLSPPAQAPRVASGLDPDVAAAVRTSASRARKAKREDAMRASLDHDEVVPDPGDVTSGIVLPKTPAPPPSVEPVDAPPAPTRSRFGLDQLLVVVIVVLAVVIVGLIVLLLPL